MALPALIEGVQLDPTVGNTIAELRLLKAKTHELGRGARIAWIDDFVTGQLAWAKQEMARQPGHPDPDVDERADVLFRALVAPDRSA